VHSEDNAQPTAIDTSDALSLEAVRMRSAIEQRLFRVDAMPVRVGRFVVLDVIGQGGMGTVYRAYDPRLDRRVAVKVLREGHGATAVRLEREAQALARLSHPNVVTIHEVGDAPHGVFVAMEHVDGGTLGQWCREHAGRTRQRWRKLLAFALQAADGLAAAHAMGLVHRDLKPANMLVGSDGRLRLADFGLVSVEGAPDEAVSSASDSPSATFTGDPLTATGELVGTLAYMAPEQLDGLADAKSDQFSLCATFFEAFYGVRPFAARSIDELRTSFTRGLVPRPAGSHVPSFVFRALARGLSIEPQRRFPDIAALQQALRRGSGRRTIAGIAVLGATTSALAALLWSRPDPCIVDVDALGTAWDGERRAEVSEAFAASASPAALATLARIEPRLDRVADRWAHQRADACLAEREAVPDGVAATAMQACLDHVRETFDQSTRDFASGDGETILRAVELVDLLADSTDCRAPGASDFATERGRELLDALQRARVASTLARFDEAERELREMLATTTAGEFPRLRFAANAELKRLYGLRNDDDDARRHAEQALDDAEESGDPDLIAHGWGILAATLDQSEPQAPVEQVQFTFERARRLERLDRLSRITIADLDWKEAGFLHRRGRYSEAIPVYERAIAGFVAEGAPRTAHAQLQLGQCMTAAADLRGGLAMIERGLLTLEAQLGPDHPEVAVFRLVHGDALRVALDLEPAEGMLDRAIEVLEAHPDFEPRNRAHAYTARAKLKLTAGRSEEALVDYDQALAVLRALGHREGPIVAELQRSHATALMDLGRHDEALTEVEGVMRRELQPLDEVAAENTLLRAKLLALTGRNREAGVWLDRARELAARAHPATSVNGLRAAERIAAVLGILGRAKEAVELLERALVHAESGNDAWRVRLEIELAKAHRDSGNRPEALRHLRLASEIVDGGTEVAPPTRTALATLLQELESSEP